MRLIASELIANDRAPVYFMILYLYKNLACLFVCLSVCIQ